MEAIVLWLVIVSNPIKYAEPSIIEAPSRSVCEAQAKEKNRGSYGAWCVPLVREKK